MFKGWLYSLPLIRLADIKSKKYHVTKQKDIKMCRRNKDDYKVIKLNMKFLSLIHI